ncbi:MAG: hypothetical protein QOC57_772 [Ilumatobacteraceae bacterium]|jgi:hypothetical protein
MIRVRIEMAVAIVFAVLAGVTTVWPTWIESITGLEPDRGSGATEWGVVAMLALAAVAAAALAGRDYRRLHAVH